MKTVWKKIRLGDICEVIPGFAFKSKDFQDSGIPVVKIKNIRNDHTVDLTDVDCVPEEILNDKTKRFLLHNGDILVAMTGATAGKVGKIRTQKPVLLNQRVAKIKPVKADPQFIWSVVSSDEYESLFHKLADGAAQPNMSGSQIEDIGLLLPPIGTQRKIAAILSAYDDLIENNTRRIKILEEMAQMIYREWFVHFRFPGHEKVKMVDSPLGKIPEGWEVKNLFEIADVTYGFPFKSTLFATEPLNKPVVRIRDITSQESKTYTSETPDERYLICNGDLLVGMDGDFHMGKWSGGFAYLNQRVVRFRPKSLLSRYFLFLALKAPIEHLDSTVVGTTVAHLSDKDLRAINISVPNESLIKQINSILEAIYKLEIDLRLKYTNLRRTRDLLLPKLISGEVEVEDIEVRVPSGEMG